jgi:hypothetical protein
VVTFEIHNGFWEPEHTMPERGLLVDTFYGVAYPLEGRGLSPEMEEQVRKDVTAFSRAQVGKPYNLNFLKSDTDETFYCSQLAYRAYLRCGIDLNTGQSIPHVPGTSSIIFPQEIWNGCIHRMTVEPVTSKQ